LADAWVAYGFLRKRVSAGCGIGYWPTWQFPQASPKVALDGLDDTSDQQLQQLDHAESVFGAPAGWAGKKAGAFPVDG